MYKCALCQKEINTGDKKVIVQADTGAVFCSLNCEAISSNPTTVGALGSIGQAVKTTPIMKYFEYGHLPENLQIVSRYIFDLAYYMDTSLPAGAEKSAGLRKLLEAKDCFVRANLGG